MYEITVRSGEVRGKISDGIYAQMVEHAYWSVHLGLCAQMLDNGGFELDRYGDFPEVAQGWYLTTTNSHNTYKARLDGFDPYNALYSQQITIEKYVSGQVELFQPALNIKSGVDYTGFLFLKGDGKVRAQLELRSVNNDLVALQELGEVSHGEWQKYEISLSAGREGFNGSFILALKGEGSVWVDQAQLYPSDSYLGHGTRKDMVEYYKDLKPSIIRWPGGTYLIWHQWKNGIGPLEDRHYGDGRRLVDKHGVAHWGEWDPNTFGTDEFIQFCRDVGAEPMININIKDGLDNALDWMEYCNGDATTKWGGIRAKNGHEEPYNVKYWVVDNEPLVLSDDKAFNRKLYPILARQFAEAMRQKDPSAQIFIFGDHDLASQLDGVPPFSEEVAKECKSVMDALCLHCYYDQTVYGALQGTPYRLGESLARIKEMMDSCSGDGAPKVALTEWNPEANTDVAGNMGQAIEAAQVFLILERLSADGVIDYASMCQLCVNVDRYRGRWLRSAMVQIDKARAWVSPMYHVTAAFSQHYQPHLVETDLSSIPQVESQIFEGYEFPALDVVATVDEGGDRIVIKAVNNTEDQELQTRLNLEGIERIRSIRAVEITADSIHTMNSQYSRDNVGTSEVVVEADASSFDYIFRPLTVTVFEVTL
jgi:alpha-N-arabinofuranosidase